jgi:H/ACA ribonucleoprotein complex subunit 4
MASEKKIEPTKETTAIDTSKWPLLLKNYDQLNVRTGHYVPLPHGCSPLARSLEQHLLYGIINLDKPVNPSSHEVVYAFQCSHSFSTILKMFKRFDQNLKISPFKNQ